MPKPNEATHYNKITINEIVEEKIQLLYDFCVLRGSRKNPDPLEAKTRALLPAKKTEFAMQTAIHDVLKGEKTLVQILKIGGVL